MLFKTDKLHNAKKKDSWENYKPLLTQRWPRFISTLRIKGCLFTIPTLNNNRKQNTVEESRSNAVQKRLATPIILHIKITYSESTFAIPTSCWREL